MDKISGVVAYLNDIKGFKNIRLEDGNYYGLGKNKHQGVADGKVVDLKKGDIVSFQATQNDRGYWQVDEVPYGIVVETKPVTKANGKTSTNTNGDAREREQRWRSASYLAVEVTSLLATTGALFSKNATKQAVEQEVTSRIGFLAERFYSSFKEANEQEEFSGLFDVNDSEGHEVVEDDEDVAF